MLRWVFPRVYEGWIVVGASGTTVLIIAASFFYGFGTIFTEVIDEFGWSVAATSLAFSLRSEVGGLAAPFVGVLIDRIGAQIVIVGGIVIVVAGVLGMSFIQEIWHFYVAMIVIAIGTSAAGGQVGLAAIATWFERRRARAMSFMTVGGGLGGLLVVLIAWMVEQVGWRDALRILAFFMATVGTLIALNIRARPLDHPQPMDGLTYVEQTGINPAPAIRWGIPWRKVLRTRSFIFVSLGLVAISYATTSVVVHQIPYLERDLDVSKALAGATVAVFTVASIVGRLGFGILADRYPKRWMMAWASVPVAAGLPFLIWGDSMAMALIGILLIAPGFGGVIPVRPAMLADYYGTRYFGTINGMAALVTTTGGALGPWLVGRLVDQTGNYDQGWITCGVATLISIPLFILATPPDDLVEEYRGQVHGEIADVRASLLDAH